uniref:Disease resistance protein At4g27190-like leucine-rich repeats domain-containing protein n=1 Tax=Ananas comosus var. bracteatus TaxID=296719 RepID=A0A6V7QEA2_ANACO|nr:unnamed protein product [Ananas comosus var. bracteatus]
MLSWKEIEAYTYEELESKVVECLRDERVWDIYVYAWEGVGASAVLRRAAEAVEKKELIRFDTVIKLVRFTIYGSPREAQRAVAEQLINLEPAVMAKLDEADEEDDFSGVPAGSRGMMPEVAEEIRLAVKDRRVLLLLGSVYANQFIDFNDLEIPIARWAPTRGRGRGRGSRGLLGDREAVARWVSPAGEEEQKLWKEIVTSGGLMSSSPPELLPPKTLVIRRDIYYEHHRDAIQSESYRWMAVQISPDDPAELLDFLDNICGQDVERGTSVYGNISSIFWNFEWTHRALPDRFFERFSNVRVLDLSGCIVGPIDSSFVHLRNLRMLKMERCQVTGERSSVNASPRLLAQEGLGGPILFDSLWVLILYNSDADKFLSAGKAFDSMPNLHKFDLTDKTFAFPLLGARKGLGSLRKLRINCPVVQLEGIDEGFFQHMHKFLSMAINLKKLILDNCDWLESLNLNHLPATIKTVSLRSCTSLQEVEPADPTSLPNLKTFRLSESVLITKLCLQGCRKLENVDLQELLKLEELNLSCTAVKVLKFFDEESRPYNLPRLKQLYLLGCEQLCRVVLGKEGELPSLDELYLDNYNNTCGVDRCLESFKNQTEHYDTTTGISHDADGRVFQAHVVVRDVRLFRSLKRAFPAHLDRTRARIHIHVKCSSTIKRGDITYTTTKPGARTTSTTKSSPLIVSNLSTPRYADALAAMKDHRRPHRPSPPAMPLNNHIEVDGGNHRSLTEEESFRRFMRFAESLFVHENTSAIAANVSMSSLKCFRIENCPNMEVVFADWDKGGRNVLVKLESMWLSHLPRLDAICKRGIMIVPESYSQLKHIYLEFCTRLKYVLPSLSEPCNLETIDIRYCGDLTAIFTDYDDDEEKRGAIPKLLPKLRSLHLEELPKLQHIYKPNICAPSLQDIVIRGCSSLRKLSLFDRSDGRSKRVVKISCEKDWWVI